MGNGQRAATMMALQMENGAISQGIHAAFRCWKRQENEFFLRASMKKCSLAELDFCPVRLCQTSNVPNCKIIKLCCLATKICDSLLMQQKINAVFMFVAT